MKLQLLLFFAIVSPLLLFLATIMYGGHATAGLKKDIADSGAYNQIASKFKTQDIDTMAKFSDYTVYTSKLLTPSFFQEKIESTIDDSANWITGKSANPPVISFKELKEELQRRDIILLNSLEHVPSKTQMQKSKIDTQEQQLYQEQASQLASFTNADFTFPLGNQLDGVKFVYNILQFALPVLFLLLICSLFLIGANAESPPLKYKWIGLTLLASSLAGLLCIILHPFFIVAIMGTQILQELNTYPLFAPIIPAVINHYVNVYVGYQTILSAVFFVSAALCFGGAYLTRKQIVPKIKPVYEVKSYWETPLKEKPITQPSETPETK